MRFLNYFNKDMRNCFSFFSFKGLTQVKTSITHNKYLPPQFSKDNDPISAKSVVQILSSNLIYTFLLLNFLITGLCNS